MRRRRWSAQAEPPSVPGSAGHARPRKPRSLHPPPAPGPTQVVNAQTEANDRQRYIDAAGQSSRGGGGAAHRTGNEHRGLRVFAGTPTNLRTLPAGFVARADAGVHSSGWPLAIVGNRDGSPWYLSRGDFTMGNDNGARRSPAHKVSLTTYYIDQHEVTVRQFRLFLAETHYRGQPPQSWSEDFRQNPSDSLPMVMVNARDAQGVFRVGLEATAHRGPMGDGRGRPTAGSSPGVPNPSSRQSRVTPRARLNRVMTVAEDVSAYGVRSGGKRPGVDEGLVRFEVLPPAFPPAAVNPTGPPPSQGRWSWSSRAIGKSGSASAVRESCWRSGSTTSVSVVSSRRRPGRCRQSGRPAARKLPRDLRLPVNHHRTDGAQGNASGLRLNLSEVSHPCADSHQRAASGSCGHACRLVFHEPANRSLDALPDRSEQEPSPACVGPFRCCIRDSGPVARPRSG